METEVMTTEIQKCDWERIDDICRRTFWNWRLYWSLEADLDMRPDALMLQSLRLRPSEK